MIPSEAITIVLTTSLQLTFSHLTVDLLMNPDDQLMNRAPKEPNEHLEGAEGAAPVKETTGSSIAETLISVPLPLSSPAVCSMQHVGPKGPKCSR